MQTLFDKTKNLLISKPELRDNDELLAVAFWIQELKKDGLTLDIPLKIFFERYQSGKHTTADSVTRTRQMCNLKHVETRGKLYQARRNNEPAVRQEINDIMNNF